MTRKRRESYFWKSHFRISGPQQAPEAVAHLSYRDSEFTDEELCFLCAGIKKINRLDLDNSRVGNKGVQCLTQLKDVRELRLKGLQIDDTCIPSLQQLSNLELLHLGGTKITCEGIAELATLKNLKRLLCSPALILPEKLHQFRKAVPQCELVVNYQIFL